MTASTTTKCGKLYRLQRDQRRLRHDPSLTSAFAALISGHIEGCPTCQKALDTEEVRAA